MTDVRIEPGSVVEYGSEWAYVESLSYAKSELSALGSFKMLIDNPAEAMWTYANWGDFCADVSKCTLLLPSPDSLPAGPAAWDAAWELLCDACTWMDGADWTSSLFANFAINDDVFISLHQSPTTRSDITVEVCCDASCGDMTTAVTSDPATLDRAANRLRTLQQWLSGVNVSKESGP